MGNARQMGAGATLVAMPTPPIRFSQVTRRSARMLCWLLAFWVLGQSWAWMHRVEHGAHFKSVSQAPAELFAVAPDGMGPTPESTPGWSLSGQHAGFDCEWLDHALLGSAAAAQAVEPHWAPAEGVAPSLEVFSCRVQTLAHAYQARAPPRPLLSTDSGRIAG